MGRVGGGRGREEGGLTRSFGHVECTKRSR